MTRKVVALTGFLMFGSLAEAEAKQLYVNPATGNDATSYANNSSSAPWATIGRAAWGSTNRNSPNTSEAARAGDTVLIAPGIYRTTGTDNRFIPAYNPVNSGTAGNPIVFRGDPSESQLQGPSSASVILQLTSSSGPVIGAMGRNYIVWDGFYVDEANAATRADTGPVTVSDSSHVTLRNLELRGTYANWVSNHNGVRLERASFATVQNSRIYGFGQINGGRNQRHENNTGVTFYESSDCIIESNEIYDVGVGVWIKGDQPTEANQARNIIRYNLIYRVGENGGGAGIQVSGSQDSRVYQNVVLAAGTTNSGGLGIHLKSFGPSVNDGPRRDVVQNNTVIGQTVGCITFNNDVHEAVRVFNNVCSSSDSGVNGGTTPSAFTFEHNLYHAVNTTAQIVGSGYSLAAWKSTFGKDSVNPGAISSDPLFVDPARRDYRLQTLSPARGLGRDLLNLSGLGAGAVIPAGAYITGNEIIGIGGGEGAPPPPPPAVPAAPTNLRIVQ